MNTSSRRNFLQFVTSQTALATMGPVLAPMLVAGCQSTRLSNKIVGIAPSFEDKLLLAPGLGYKVLCRWGDKINTAGDRFGFNNDFTCFLPFKNKSDEGLLWVNHETATPEFIHNKETSQLTRSKQEMLLEQTMVGGSILHIKKNQGQWQRVLSSKYNRRLDAQTKIPFSGGVAIKGQTHAIGTLANCAGGLTPWGTFLTSEENYDSFYGETVFDNEGRSSIQSINNFDWRKHFSRPPEHYGWIVEVDPYTGKAEKLLPLGRAPHEGATPVLTKAGKAVVYMGEDRTNGFIYKFVSDGAHLKSGTLYAADTINGKWLPLDLKLNSKLKKHFKNQVDILTYSHRAAEIAGATKQDRPEDIEINKANGDIFVAITKNPDTGNKFGSLLKIQESGDHDSTNFKSSTWVSGGLDTGMACPDNICFDNKNNMWVTVDMSEKEIGKGPYKAFGHNGLYVIPLSGSQAGVPIQVASAPRDAELTGPWFSPDYKTLFLSVQHPGSQSRKHMSRPTSSWPDGPGQLPKASVVAIQGDFFNKL